MDVFKLLGWGEDVFILKFSWGILTVPPRNGIDLAMKCREELNARKPLKKSVKSKSQSPL